MPFWKGNKGTIVLGCYFVLVTVHYALLHFGRNDKYLLSGSNSSSQLDTECDFGSSASLDVSWGNSDFYFCSTAGRLSTPIVFSSSLYHTCNFFPLLHQIQSASASHMSAKVIKH